MTTESTVQVTGVDAENPWPGLESFRENDAFFFHGRDQEAADLFRLVKRESLTILFSRSGLGKTSLLRAGLFPRLRAETYLPFYIRLDYALTDEPLSEQVRATIKKAVELGECEAPPLPSDRSLWECLHTKDADFWNRKNVLVTPVFVFDQFEEIFTLGTRTDEHRARSDAFLKDLSDLIENRPPQELRERLNSAESEMSNFTFGREVCKVILSLREDYLPELESMRASMPSVMSNRLRIMSMTGQQAFDVVSKSGGHLVEQKVARQIVRFVAAAAAPNESVSEANLTELEVDPALLSLFCRKLNDERLQSQAPAITSELVGNSSLEILKRFYVDCVADPAFESPAQVREFVEECLLTKSGHRDTIAVENALEEAGITQDVIDRLVGRRLLRLDERQKGVQRVELAHDVLIGVISASREARHQEKKEAAERMRAEQERREAEERAKQEHDRAEKERAEKERFEDLMNQARKARNSADDLIRFIVYNLSARLNATGQLQLLAEVNDKAVEYFAGFRPSELDDTSKWSKAVALNSQASSNQDAGKLALAVAAYSEALAIFRELVQNPDATETHYYMLAHQCSSLAWGLISQGKTNEALELYREAFRIVQPLKPDPSWSYASSYFRDRIGDILKLQGKLEEGMKLYYESLEEKKAQLAKAEAPPTIDYLNSLLADSYVSIGDGLRASGQLEEALRLFRDSLEIRKKAAERNTLDVNVQHTVSQSYDRVGEALQAYGNMKEAQEAFTNSDEIFNRLIELDKGETSATWRRNYTVTRSRLAEIRSLAGDTAFAFQIFTGALALRKYLASIDETNADAFDDLAETHLKFGEAAFAYGKLQEAEQNFQQSFEMRTRLAQQDPTNTEREGRVAEALERLGDLACARANFQLAYTHYTDARIIRERLSKLDPTNVWRRIDLATSLEKLGDAHAGFQQLDVACQSYQAALEIRQQLTVHDPKNAQWQAQLAVSFRKLADAYRSGGDFPTAVRHYFSGSEIMNTLLGIAEDYAEWMSYFGDLLNSFAIARRMNGETQMALAGLRPTMDFRQALASLDAANVKRQAELAWTQFLTAISILEVEPQSQAEAHDLLGKARATMRTIKNTAELTAEQSMWFDEIDRTATAQNVSEPVATPVVEGAPQNIAQAES
jgi:tetratricopeptide (TPR) repeat protein